MAETVFTRFSKKVLTLQFLWFLGHLSTILMGSYYLIFGLHKPYDHSYYKSFYGAILTYSIITFKSHGIPQISKAYLTRILMDENVQYMLLATIWLTSKPLFVTLIPYCVFSLFHSLTYIRSELLSIMKWDSGSKLIQQFVSAYQVKALKFVAYSEVWFIFPWIIVSLFRGHVSLFTPILYANFLRFRYVFSPDTKIAFSILRKKSDELILESGRVPEVVGRGYVFVREAVIKYGNVEAEAVKRDNKNE